MDKEGSSAVSLSLLSRLQSTGVRLYVSLRCSVAVAGCLGTLKASRPPQKTTTQQSNNVTMQQWRSRPRQGPRSAWTGFSERGQARRSPRSDCTLKQERALTLRGQGFLTRTHHRSIIDPSCAKKTSHQVSPAWVTRGSVLFGGSNGRRQIDLWLRALRTARLSTKSDSFVFSSAYLSHLSTLCSVFHPLVYFFLLTNFFIWFFIFHLAFPERFM